MIQLNSNLFIRPYGTKVIKNIRILIKTKK